MKRRLEGGGRKAALPDLEEELASWIDYLRATNICITRSNVHSKALELAEARGNATSCASQGWVDKFLKQHSFSL